MCGPLAAQTSLEASQAAFYTQLQQQDATEYGEDQGILKQMQSVYAPILAAGPNVNGFSQAQTDSLNTEATEGVAKNFAGARRALQENEAARGGGDTYLPSGVVTNEEGSLDAGEAQEQSQEEQQITQAGYTQGYDEFNRASSALQGTAALLNPDGTAGVANTAGSDEGTTAAQIEAENESWMAPLAGAVGAVGGAATGAFINKK